MSMYKWDKVNPVSDKPVERLEPEPKTGDETIDKMMDIFKKTWGVLPPKRQLRGGWNGGEYVEPLDLVSDRRGKDARETGEQDPEWDDYDDRGLRIVRTKK